MPCAAFEDLLSGYDELTAAERRRADSHLAICADCREYLETLAGLDRELSGLYKGLQPRAGFSAGTRLATEIVSCASAFRRPRPPSAWPEVLDFCGWAAVVAIVALLAVTAAARAGITL